MSEHSFQNLGIAVLKTEAEAITALIDRIDDRFHRACEMILDCRGRIVVTGMGKSGHIGNKIAATLASTGTPAFFVHAAEAAHGDLGMITRDDAILAFSWSGVSSSPWRAIWSFFTVSSTPAACSPPMTEIRADGHDHRKRGSYARPDIP